MTDASLTYSTSNDRFSLSVFGQILTDQTVVSNTFFVPSGTFATGVLRPPRTFGVRVGTHFKLSACHAVARWRHPGILPIFDPGEVDGIPEGFAVLRKC